MASWAENRRADTRYTANTHHDYDLEAVPRSSWPDERPPSWDAQQTRRLGRYYRQETLKELHLNGRRGAQVMLDMHDEINRQLAARPDLHPAKEDALRRLEMVVDYGVIEIVRRTVGGA